MASVTKVAKIEIESLGLEILTPAYAAADEAASEQGRSKGGWIRLCKVQGSSADPYVVAIRKVGTPGGFQFGCGCKDWIYRRQKTGQLCKHQRAYLAEAVENPGKFWMYRAGVAFAQTVATEIAPQVHTAIHGAKANEASA
jgi:hypothetical protein